MKNTRDPFDDELRNRLDNYSEEPDDKLWSGIASNIETVKPPFNWTKWLSIGSAVVIITSGVLYLSLNESMDNDIADAAKTSLVEQTVKQNVQTDDATTDLSALKEAEPGEVESQPVAGAEVANDESAGRKSESIHNAVAPKEMVGDATQRSSVDQETTRSQSADAQRMSSEEISKAHVAPVTSAASSTKEERIVKVDNVMIDSKPVASPKADIGSSLNPVVPVAVEKSTSNEQPPLVQSLPSTAEQQNAAGAIVKNVTENDKIDRQSSTTPETATEKDSLSEKQEAITTTKADVSQAKADDSSKKKTNRKLSLYLTAMPTFGYQRVEANQNDNVFIESISKVSNFSTKRLGVRAEIGAEYALSPKFRVFGGVLYYQRKQTIDYIERVPVNNVVDNPVDTVVIIQPEFTSQARTFEYELRNLGVQIGLNYVLKEKKFLHTVGTGIEFHKALNSLPESHEELGFNSNPSTFVFANLYYRLQYPAQGKLRAVFQPTFNYSLYLNQDMNAPFFVKPYGLGLNLGLTYHF